MLGVQVVFDVEDTLVKQKLLLKTCCSVNGWGWEIEILNIESFIYAFKNTSIVSRLVGRVKVHVALEFKLG